MASILKKASIDKIEDGYVSVLNPDVAGNPRSYLSSAVAAGATTINLVNSASFAVNDYCLIGKMGDEKTELVKIATIPGNTSITCGATKFPHSVDTQFILIGTNQIRVYSASSKTGSYVLRHTFDITPDDITTDWEDVDWLPTDYYKVAYYNSTTAAESHQLSGAVAGTGHTFFSRKRIADRILAVCRDESGAAFPRSDVNDWVNEVVEFFCNTILSIDEEFFLTDTGETTAAAQLVSLPTGFRNLKRLWVAYDGTTYYPAQRVLVQDDEPDRTYDAAQPRYIFDADDKLSINPWQSGTKYRLIYTANPTILTDDADEIPTILRSYTRAFVDYGLYRSSVAEGKAPKGAPLPPSVTEAEKQIKAQVSNRKSDYPDEIGRDEMTMTEMVEGLY